MFVWVEPPPPLPQLNEHIHYMYMEKCWPRNAGIVYMMRNTWWCLALRSILGKAWCLWLNRRAFRVLLERGWSRPLERGWSRPPDIRSAHHWTALTTARDHEVCESALQKTSTNSGLDMKASPWAKFVILWISSSPKRPGRYAKPHAAIQKCRFFFQTNKLRPFPLSNKHRSVETKCR